MNLEQYLDKLWQLEKSKVPTGEKSLGRTVTDEMIEIALNPPWISFTFTNDGPGDVLLRINDLTGDDIGSRIDSDETYNFNATYPIVKKIFLVTKNTGATAVVRIRALVGRSIDV